MKKESLSEAGYLVLTIVIAFIVLIGISKASNKRLIEKGEINATK